MNQQLCINCNINKPEENKTMCSHCFSNKHRCKNCDQMASPFHVQCDSCYHGNKPRVSKKEHLCIVCNMNEPDIGKSMCNDCFGKPHKCKTCEGIANSYRIQCDSCYQIDHKKQFFKCRDCNNAVKSLGSLCDHCFSVSHRCLGRLPNGDECEDYTLGGSVLCVECRKRKYPDRYGRKRSA